MKLYIIKIIEIYKKNIDPNIHNKNINIYH